MKRLGDLGFVATKKEHQIGTAWIRNWSESDHGYGFHSLGASRITKADRGAFHALYK